MAALQKVKNFVYGVLFICYDMIKQSFMKSEKSLSKAMDRAIDQCVKEGLLKEYLLKKKAKVKLMLLTEFDEELFAKTIKEEGENRLSQLYLKLVAEKRTQDLECVICSFGVAVKCRCLRGEQRHL